jgi:hypothetical protein
VTITNGEKLSKLFRGIYMFVTSDAAVALATFDYRSLLRLTSCGFDLGY